MIVGKVAGVEYLEAGVVLAIESGHSRRTARRLSSCGRVKPQAQMIHLDGIERRVQAVIREWSAEDYRCGRRTLRERKCLHAKTADEALMTVPILVRHNVAL